MVLIGHATLNGYGCADYEQPLREGGVGGRYALEMGRERLGDYARLPQRSFCPRLRPKTMTPPATATQDST